MALMFHRRLAIPLWGLAFCAIALAAPAPATLLLMAPSTRFALAVVGITVMLFTIARAIPGLRTSRSVARVYSKEKTRAAVTVAAGTRVWTLHEPDRRTAEDALELVRMDDDGGWQMATPPTEQRLGSSS
jgi:uncharacterized protein (DUF58 family)